MTEKNKNEINVETSNKKKIFFTPRQVIIMFVIFLLGILLIFSSYAWFSTALNVKVKEFNMIVSKNGGLSISYSLINSIVNGLKVIVDLGRSLGSAIRRGSSGKLCPI